MWIVTIGSGLSLDADARSDGRDMTQFLFQGSKMALHKGATLRRIGGQEHTDIDEGHVHTA